MMTHVTYIKMCFYKTIRWSKAELLQRDISERLGFFVVTVIFVYYVAVYR